MLLKYQSMASAPSGIPVLQSCELAGYSLFQVLPRRQFTRAPDCVGQRGRITWRHINFGGGEPLRIPDRVLERYEMLHHAGLASEVERD
jgi:hypothetical protein